MKFRDAYRQGLVDAQVKAIRKKELKALRASPPSSDWIIMQVQGLANLRAAEDLGWELISSLSLGRGAGFVTHVVRKTRSQVVLDTTGITLVR